MFDRLNSLVRNDRLNSVTTHSLGRLRNSEVTAKELNTV